MAHSDENFFTHTIGGFVLHSQKEGDAIPGCRFVLGRVGESTEKIVEQFWSEQPAGNFQIVVLFAYGLPPRRELTSQKSLSAALATIDLEPGNALTARWLELCRDLDVAVPKRLQKVA